MPVWSVASGTGHRPDGFDSSSIPWVRSEAFRLAKKLAEECGTEVGISGMALGWDTWWAQGILAAGLRLWAHVPFPQQPDRWPNPVDRAEWQRLLDLAWKVTPYGDLADVDPDRREATAPRLLHARNDGMRAESSVIVAAKRSSATRGGTWTAYDKAERAGLPIIHVDPDTRETRIRNYPPRGRLL